ncbi:MAG TPA: hypothetical protein PLV42_02835 [bacterium]|nr:hypothetical protein [bacterium]
MNYRMLLLFAPFILAALFCAACDDGSTTETDTDTIVDKDILTDTAPNDDDELSTDEAIPDDEPFVPTDCIPITATAITLDAELSKYVGPLSEPIGKVDMTDMLSIEFYLDATTLPTELKVGLYNLATPPNDNYATCTECVRILGDYDTERGGYTRSFFQYDGTLEITEAQADSLKSKGNFSARLVEVTIDKDTNRSTPVTGGACYEVTGSWDTICTPDCTGKSCGGDGCGGICGDGCEPGTQCNEDQTGCIACTAVTVTDIVPKDRPEIYEGTLTENLGGEFPDLFYLGFEGTQTADTYDLAGVNYADCVQCVLVVQDKTTDPAATPKFFFQESGTLVIEDMVTLENGFMGAESKGHMSGVRLVEVTIDNATYVSTPVPDGGCLTITEAAWDTMPAIR